MRSAEADEAVSIPLRGDRHNNDNNNLLAFASPLWASTPQAAVRVAVAAMANGSPWHALLRDACAHASMRAKGAAECPQPPMVVAGVVLGVSATHVTSAAAALVGERFLCVSLGSGTRCSGAATSCREGGVSASDPRRTATLACSEAFVLRDGHAEVMARRGFVAFLLDAVDEAVAQNGHSAAAGTHLFVERHLCTADAARLASATQATSMVSPRPDLVTSWGGWALRRGVRVHLVCTHWPCGALSSLAEGQPSGGLLLGVPSMRADGNDEAADAVDDEVTYVRGHRIARHRTRLDSSHAALCATRTKPGKGHPNLNMSCSDKLWRWSVLGLQGRRRAGLFPHPIPLHALHIAATDTVASAKVTELVATMFGQRAAYLRGAAVLSSVAPTTISAALAQLGREAIPPAVHLFTVEELAQQVRSRPGPKVCSAQSAMPGVCDSAYSRSTWLTGAAAPKGHTTGAWAEAARLPSTQMPGVKRAREGDGTSGGPLWSVASASLVLNTKAGLPQGAGVAQLHRRLYAAAASNAAVNDAHVLECSADDKCNADAMQQRSVATQLVRLTAAYPLSRAWMAARVRGLCAAQDLHPVLPRPALAADEGEVTTLRHMMCILSACDEQLRLPVCRFCTARKGNYVCGGSMPVLLRLMRVWRGTHQQQALLWTEKCDLAV